MPHVNKPTREPLLAAAALWALSSIWYLVSETVTGRAFADYSYSHNYVSDLGVVVDSPLADVMNLAFVQQGVLGIFAAIFAFRAFRRANGRSVFLGLAVVQGLGNILVGIVHSGGPSRADSTPVWHTGGAAIAILGGNLSVIVAGIVLHRCRRARSMQIISAVLGIAGIASFAMLLVNMTVSPVLLGDGAWERATVYTIIAWQLVSALAVFVTAGRGRSPA